MELISNFLFSIPIWGQILLAVYGLAGLICAGFFIREESFSFPEAIGVFLIILIGWLPIFLIVMGSGLYDERKRKAGQKNLTRQKSAYINARVNEACRDKSDTLSDAEYQSLCQVQANGFDPLTLIKPELIKDVLTDFWERDIDPHLPSWDSIRRRAEDEDENEVLFSLSPEIKESRVRASMPTRQPKRLSEHYSAIIPKKQEWSFKLSSDFLKAIKKADKTTKARIMTSLTEICVSPLDVKGKTQKPLVGDKVGIWSYRIGDSRLLYVPDPDEELILFVSFSSRGSAYS
jgi:mRNA-degrading endonuclease RelE of RelBE toxin-antitoxin system